MSLPEELPLLDCNKLHKHMIQVGPAAYTQPSSSCDQALKALKLFFLLRIKLLWNKFHSWLSLEAEDSWWSVLVRFCQPSGFLSFWQNLKIGTFCSSVLMRPSVFQMYQCLSAPADSNTTRRRFQELDDELFTQLKALVPQDHQTPTGTTDSTNVTDGEGKKSLMHKADSQSTQSSTTSSKLDYSNVTPPHLNPFIVPLTLLKRRQNP